ncbi:MULTISPECIES: cryptochrome/photolyase family protein [Sphingobacterium]|uniref:Deoxyribodipyrimidine photo-lyase n=1 Tax=Sphingobacterium tenebrionis TaxID=3111775 RepID=A0ABU8I3X6_9SPHI|nr:deoxyribodipyrimidine photo-lyase [Sphingobacterium sp. 1.A.4]
MDSASPIHIFWFRRDLRIADNVGLSEALKDGLPVLPIFIFDTDILSRLEDPYDRRVDFIHQAVAALKASFQKSGSSLKVFHGNPLAIFKDLIAEYRVEKVYWNRDYEPDALKRDQEIISLLENDQIKWKSFKDQVIFEGNEVLKSNGHPYTVYTPYAKRWRMKLDQEGLDFHQAKLENLLTFEDERYISLEELGFQKTDMEYSEPIIDLEQIQQYDKLRDYPAQDGSTKIGIHLRFGTISIRECVKVALENNATWLSELIWREFFMQILYHFPRVVHESFKREYDQISWRNNPAEFALWCAGETGYPLVDAGMRELNSTGFMHNRVRMLVASFLTKHLLIDWRWGEAYFASKLNDYELASNNGNWQWAAGCGCDAAPYFRIFNPSIQQQKFDKQAEYIHKWLDEKAYTTVSPMVEHGFARERAIATYKKGLTAAK